MVFLADLENNWPPSKTTGDFLFDSWIMLDGHY